MMTNNELKTDSRKTKNPINFQVIFLVFLSLFLGTISLCLGLVNLAKYNMAKSTNATIVSVEYFDNHTKAEVVYEYEVDGKPVHGKVKYLNVKLNKNSYSYPYYEGKEETIRYSKSDVSKIVLYSSANTLAIVFGALFDIVGFILLYAFVIRKPNLASMMQDYNLAIYSDDKEKSKDKVKANEEQADELNKLNPHSIKHKFGMAKVWKNRLSNNFKNSSLGEKLFVIIFQILIIVWAVIDEVVIGKYHGFLSLIVSILFWMFLGTLVMAILMLLFRMVFHVYLKLLIKLKKFNKEEIAEVLSVNFVSEQIVNFGEFGKNHVLKRTFRVVVLIDNKKSVGYVSGLLPPEKGTKLKVLVNGKNSNRFILNIKNEDNLQNKTAD